MAAPVFDPVCRDYLDVEDPTGCRCRRCYALTWVWDLRCVGGVAKHILFELAWGADPVTGLCTASVQKVHEDTGYGVTTIRQHLRGLEQKHLLITHPSRGGRSLASTHYIALHDGVPRPEASEEPIPAVTTAAVRMMAALVERDEPDGVWRCRYCRHAVIQLDRPWRHGLPWPERDHVVPRSRSGTDDWENFVLACASCNARKSNRLLSELPADWHLWRDRKAVR